MPDEIIVHPLPANSIPPVLYRIDYPGSWTYHDNIVGFRAKDRTAMGPATITQFANHLRWNVNIPSRFISTVSDKSYAISWARSLDKYRDPLTRGAVRIMTINPADQRSSMYVYNMKRAFDEAGVAPPEDLREYMRDKEYLVLGRIPASCVTRIEVVDAIPEDTIEHEDTELNIADPRVGFDEFVRALEELCVEMQLLRDSFSRLSAHTRNIIECRRE